MERLSQWARTVAPSPTLEVDAKAKALKAQGKDVFGLGAGEPDFDTPEFIKEACVEALKAGKTKYAPVAGVMALREALARSYQKRGLQVGPAQVLVSCGAKFSCYLGLLALCQPGDEVLIPAPYWVSYPEMVKLTGATPRILKTTRSSGFRLDPKDLEAALTPQSRVLILNSPNNPTGVVYTREEITAFVDIALKHRLYILSDEIYEHLLYDNCEHVSPASLSTEAAAHTLTISGFSKSFSMTGWRLGTTVGPENAIKAMTRLQSQMTSGVTTFAQYGALAALEYPIEASQAIARMRTSFDSRRRLVTTTLEALPNLSYTPPQGAFYVFMDISALGMSSKAFATDLLEATGVAVVPGEAFGEDSAVRLSYATSVPILEAALARIADFVQ